MRAGRRRWKEMSPGKRALVIARWIVTVAAVMALAGLAVMLLWNRIMAGIFGLPALGFWDAIGLYILVKLLFSGRGSSFFARMRMRRFMRDKMAKRGEPDDGSID